MPQVRNVRRERESARLQLRSGIRPVEALAVADEDVLGRRLEPGELPWRARLEEPVDADRVVADGEERIRPERVGDDEHTPARPPERDLLPVPPTSDLDHLERRLG